MKRFTHFATALMVLAAAGCSGATGNGPEPAPEPTAEDAEFEALYLARMDSAMMLYTDADVRFMTGMIGHHGQALVMSALAPTNGAGSSIRRLTARIINAQKDEIATMQQWLRDRGQTVAEIEITGTTMMVHGPEYAMHMPGMLTAEQLRELETAQGSEFDRLFLTYMIQHHEGAVTMVHELFATDGAGLDEVVFKMASDIQADQTTEIARMELMLEEMTTPGRDP
jgi:uncharacterized protein (DUF305 family)